MSESGFMDGGHDHGGHDHGHDHGGHDHAHHDHGHDRGHGNQHGHSHGGEKHNFISHLLGLDGEAHEGGGEGAAEAGGQEGQNPSQTAIWNNVVHSMGSIFKGVRITGNFLFLCLFIGFFSWLFVLYWIRHHEPLANQVLGTGAAQSATAHADRRIIRGAREAMPLKTSDNFGQFYVPNSPPAGAAPMPLYGQPAYIAESGAAAPSQFGSPYVAPVGGAPGPAPAHPAFGNPVQPSTQPMAAPVALHGQVAQPYSGYAAPTGYAQPRSAYYMPVHSGDGMRVKMMVNK